MNVERWGRKARLAVGLALVLTVWGTGGVILQGSAGQGGYSTGVGGSVAGVEEDGPADRAGLMVDDRIVRVGDHSLTQAWTKPERDRVGVGKTQSLVIDRDRERLEADVVWEALSRVHWQRLFVDYLVTLAFLGFGVWALLAAGTPAGLLLAALGLSYAAANFNGPRFAAVEGGLGFLQYNLSFLVTVVLFHFFLVFPRRKSLFGRRVPGWLVYLPFMPFLFLGLVESAVFPALLPEYRTVTAVTDLLYMVLALAALIHTAVTLGRAELRRSRFSCVLWGLAVAFGPLLALGLLRLGLPEFTLPGSGFLPLLGAVIPASMALAVVGGAGATSGEPTDQPGHHRVSTLPDTPATVSCQDVAVGTERD
jgi:hypothetical protein